MAANERSLTPFALKPIRNPALAQSKCAAFKVNIFSQKKYHRVLPFCYYRIPVSAGRLNYFILRRKGLLNRPISLGEHLRNRRLLFGVRQEDVAKQLGTMREVYDRWERDERAPVISEWPNILRFLATYPYQEQTQADLVLKARRCQGADQKSLAKEIGVIHQRLRRWEKGMEPIPDVFELRLRVLAVCN